MMDINFYKNRKVFITGHTGFKGAWMCKVLTMLGAEVLGYALESPTNPNLFDICGLKDKITSRIGDVRDLAHLKEVFEDFQPEIVIHMAAQPLVRYSYENPVHTYDVNVMGTVNILECVRLNNCVHSFINVTTDKVYKNREWEWGYRECEELNGYDPYSNSKSCSELVTDSYRNSFFSNRSTAISTVRAGNVIGGGDFAIDRIIPDCIRSAMEGKDIIVRNPYSIRPYQHVLEPICFYLYLAQEQYKDVQVAGCYNIGPNESDCIETGKLVTLFCKIWNDKMGTNIAWRDECDDGPHEANYLKLDCSRIRQCFDWKCRWNLEMALDKIVEWTKAYLDVDEDERVLEKQIREFIGE